MLFAGAGLLCAQAGSTAAEMDALLESSALTCGQAARFVIVTARLLNEDSPEDAAFDLALERRWLPASAEPGQTITLGRLSHLIMGAFGFRGSFLYAVFPGPRYAFRELSYLSIIPARQDPAWPVPGERLLLILARAMQYRENREIDITAEAL
ncbi:MAG: hypothetical protein LBQ35_05950 [Spirochaetaceae bacterium]|jgi:hypothetical protein|nr:hypothetical protein [Spirochaetaceae bacterium]